MGLLRMAGARVGCSVYPTSASPYVVREQCEEREMSSCLAAAEESCVQLAKDKCIPPFRDARIVFRVKWKGAPRLIFYSPDVAAADELGAIEAMCESEDELSDTNYRGSMLLKKK